MKVILLNPTIEICLAQFKTKNKALSVYIIIIAYVKQFFKLILIGMWSMARCPTFLIPRLKSLNCPFAPGHKPTKNKYRNINWFFFFIS